MQITIEDNSLVYIYLKDAGKERLKSDSLNFIKCHLLYDGKNNFIGMRIFNEIEDSDESIILPLVGEIEFPLHNAKLEVNESEIQILFAGEVMAEKEVVCECTIDVCEEGMVGIEPMLREKIGGKEVIKPFIIRDSPTILFGSKIIDKCTSCKSSELIEVTEQTTHCEELKGWKCSSCDQEYYLLEE
ncbi:hypothetical protein I6N90_14335 [Paenibacillus sp. GSMTC-2017]|uniref:hypothetical protein n=1 Tax=Paenibacillus sp. GSMTC-2017 TaxID=2794350 RepID=UPI0018D96953|nr:hypothetical protein [Paenibacillus sp. GSMTC-2017]MBH5318980.1 hypothetical protein [Paenibacillus sp. GSMTC-2017]